MDKAISCNQAWSINDVLCGQFVLWDKVKNPEPIPSENL